MRYQGLGVSQLHHNNKHRVGIVTTMHIYLTIKQNMEGIKILEFLIQLISVEAKRLQRVYSFLLPKPRPLALTLSGWIKSHNSNVLFQFPFLPI